MADCFFFYRIPEGHALLCLLPAGVLTQLGEDVHVDDR